MLRHGIVARVISFMVVFCFVLSNSFASEIFQKQTLTPQSILTNVPVSVPAGSSQLAEYQKVTAALTQAFGDGAIIDTPYFTAYKDTAQKNKDGVKDDANRAACLDISRNRDGATRIQIPAPRLADRDSMPYTTLSLNLLLTPDKMPEALKKGLEKELKKLREKGKAPKPKDVKKKINKYLTEFFKNQGIGIIEKQMRSHKLAAKMGDKQIAFDSASLSAAMAYDGTLMLEVPLWYKHDETAMNTWTSEIVNRMPKFDKANIKKPDLKNIQLQDHDSSLKFITDNWLELFSQLSKGDNTNIKLVTEAVKNLQVEKILDPKAHGIKYYDRLGTFISEKDGEKYASEKVSSMMKEHFGEHQRSLNVLVHLCHALQLLVVPTLDEHGVLHVVDNPQLQDAVIDFYYNVYNYTKVLFEDTDPAIYSPLRQVIGIYFTRLSRALRSDDCIEINGTDAQELMKFLADHNIEIDGDLNRKYIETMTIEYPDGWCFDILQLARRFSPDMFRKAVRRIKVSGFEVVKPSDRYNLNIWGSGRIGAAEEAQRVAMEINRQAGFYTNIALQKRALKCQSGETKYQAAVREVEEMFRDEQVINSNLKIMTSEGEKDLKYLLDNDILQFEPYTEAKVSAIQDYDYGSINYHAHCVYPVTIKIEGKDKGRIYVFDIEEYEDDMRQNSGLQQDNFPRPLLVSVQGKIIAFLNVVDCTPGGVYEGDGTVELLTDPSDYSKVTTWQLAGIDRLDRASRDTLNRLVDILKEIFVYQYEQANQDKLEVLPEGINDRFESLFESNSLQPLNYTYELKYKENGVDKTKTLYFKFTPKEVLEIENMVNNGTEINDILEKLGYKDGENSINRIKGIYKFHPEGEEAVKKRLLADNDEEIDRLDELFVQIEDYRLVIGKENSHQRREKILRDLVPHLKKIFIEQSTKNTEQLEEMVNDKKPIAEILEELGTKDAVKAWLKRHRYDLKFSNGDLERELKAVDELYDSETVTPTLIYDTSTIERIIKHLKTYEQKYLDNVKAIESMMQKKTIPVNTIVRKLGAKTEFIEWFKKNRKKLGLTPGELRAKIYDLEELFDFKPRILLYLKAQITKKLLPILGGSMHIQGPMIHKVAKIKDEGATKTTPTSCSTTGASGILLALKKMIAGRISAVLKTYHMYTGGDKKGPPGHEYPKSTGANKGINMHFDFANAAIEAVRVPTAVKNGEHEIGGGSIYAPMMLRFENPVDLEQIKHAIRRQAAEDPDFLYIIDKDMADENGVYRWEDCIRGKRAASLLFIDLFKQLDEKTIVLFVGYDNEAGFTHEQNRMSLARARAKTRQFFAALSRAAERAIRLVFEQSAVSGDTTKTRIEIPQAVRSADVIAQGV